MEDTVVVASPLAAEVPHIHLLAVFDGHRGDQAARYAQDHVQEVVCEGAGVGLDPQRALERAFVEMDVGFRADQVGESMGLMMGVDDGG